MTGIIDYGMGNLHSVANALDFIGEKYIITSDKSQLDGCDRLILPGVGAFHDAMECLKEKSFDVYLREKLAGRPLIGICLGMQLLFDKSYEGGENYGLGLIHGEVIRLTAGDKDRNYKIPHMGWNSLHFEKECEIFSALNEGCYVYFVHSYKCVPTDRGDIAAVTEYGEEIVASVSHGNIYGCQFHPEKSGQGTGLEILRNFVKL